MTGIDIDTLVRAIEWGTTRSREHVAVCKRNHDTPRAEWNTGLLTAFTREQMPLHAPGCQAYAAAAASAYENTVETLMQVAREAS